MRLGGGSYVKADRARTDVLPGGYGRQAWLARITGPHEEYAVTREFVRRDLGAMPKLGKAGAIYWSIDRPGVYEWCKFCVSGDVKTWRSDGFCVVDLERNVTPIHRSQVLAKVEEIEQQVAAAKRAG